MIQVFDLKKNKEEQFNSIDEFVSANADILNFVYQVGGEVVTPANLLDFYKNHSLERLSGAANEYQTAVVGEADEKRLKRYEKNAESATAILAGSHRPAHMLSITDQFNAAVAAMHPIITQLTLTKFCEWILIQDDIAVEAVGKIEKIFVEARQAITQATNITQVTSSLVTVKTDADAHMAYLFTKAEDETARLLAN